MEHASDQVALGTPEVWENTLLYSRRFWTLDDAGGKGDGVVIIAVYCSKHMYMLYFNDSMYLEPCHWRTRPGQ